MHDTDGRMGSGTDMPTHIRTSLRGSPRYRGLVDQREGDVHPSGVKTDLSLQGVDLLAYLALAETDAFSWGHPKPLGTEAFAFYEDGQVDDRQIAILQDAMVPASLRSVFSGNVAVHESAYTPGTTVLQMLDEAADAEHPVVGNRFVDVSGRYCFRGRHARFNPAAYGFTFWEAATENMVTSGRAQMRVLAWSDGTDMVHNIATSYPIGMDLKQISEMTLRAETSINRYGPRPWTAPNLLTKRHLSNGNTGADECLLFNQYVISNYSSPVPRITKIRFTSLKDSDSRSAATWALMTGVDIGDVVDVFTRWISGRYFVEGIRTYARELDGEIPYAEVDLDLSPAAHWTSDPF